MYITYFGHSCFQIENEGTKILFDPFIRPNALASHIDIEKINPDVVTISHGHSDHIADAEEIIRRSGAKFFTNFEIYSWLSSKGLDNGHPMNTGGSVKLDWGKLSLTPALHSSSLPDGSYGGSANGIHIQFSDINIYFAGDTDLFSDMRLIKEKYNPNVAFLPIGDNFTMDIYSAAQAAEILGTSKVIGMHYNTFPYIIIDMEEALEAFNKRGVELILMEIGSTINI
jgi:L-ascorbate metabolism protein UlaG (beta-lactamase superfamily)